MSAKSNVLIAGGVISAFLITAVSTSFIGLLSAACVAICGILAKFYVDYVDKKDRHEEVQKIVQDYGLNHKVEKVSQVDLLMEQKKKDSKVSESASR